MPAFVPHIEDAGRDAGAPDPLPLRWESLAVTRRRLLAFALSDSETVLYNAFNELIAIGVPAHNRPK